MRILLAQLNPKIGDLKGNTEKIIAAIHQGRLKQAQLVVFPELALTGYSPQDLLLLPHFIEATSFYFQQIVAATTAITAIVGLPRCNPDFIDKGLFNSAAVIHDRQLLGYYDKMLLPEYDVFTERRYFAPGYTMKTWHLAGQQVGITICEDLWQHSEQLKSSHYTSNPIQELAPLYPLLVINLSASPYSLNKFVTRQLVGTKVVSSLYCPLLFCNQVGANDGLIFDGHSYHMDANGQIVQLAKGFEEDFLLVDLEQSVYAPSGFSFHQVDQIAQLYQALLLGIRDYFDKGGFKTACLGLSGGIDSALVACLAVDALGASQVHCFYLPSRFSSTESQEDAKQLTSHLGLAYRELSIDDLYSHYLQTLEVEFAGKAVDVTEENIQARIRGLLLMAISNKEGSILLSTGNKSELAMGYMTLYGDMCGGLSVLSDVTKSQVYQLATWLNRHNERIPIRTLTKEPSAELRANQKDSDSLPAYSVIDQVLHAYEQELLAPEKIATMYHLSLSLVNDLIARLHRYEYKRRQGALGLRVSEKSLSTGRHFPIVQGFV